MIVKQQYEEDVVLFAFILYGCVLIVLHSYSCVDFWTKVSYMNA